MAGYAVVGATSWGLTLAWMLERNGHDVTVLTRTETEAAEVSARRGIARLPDLRLPEGIRLSSVFSVACDGVVIAVPAQSLRHTMASLRIPSDVPVLSAAKGIEVTTGKLMSDVLIDAGRRTDRISAISGPNLAHEIVKGLPAAAVVASESMLQAETWQRALSRPTFRIYTSDDIVGVQLAGAYKNVIAIAAGACWGLQFGANAVSTVMTRGLAEMTRLGLALGADPGTFLGLAGVGDLATTCFSPLSRNRRFGELLATGQSVQSAQRQIGEAVEGVATSGVALQVAADKGVELPICSEVAAVVGGHKTIMEAMAGLLSRPLRAEATWPG